MANLKLTDRNYLEKALQMSEGYVLNFSNRSFQEFILESTGKDIYNEKYSVKGNSKANRLRAFFEIESGFISGKLLENIYDCWNELTDDINAVPPIKIQQIANAIKQASPVTDIDCLKPIDNEKTFETLAQQIKLAIENGQPETGLDRLHTYLTKYMRVLCEKHNLQIIKETPLHSLVGAYIKQIKTKGMIESEMTERILKTSISVFESFNDVRNKQSLAHDNSILNHSESLLIFNHISNLVKFIQDVETRIDIIDEVSE